MTRYILYVSRSELSARTADADVSRIISNAAAWNISVGITGALVFTGTHFAQYIEGPADALTRLMQRLRRDSRHSHVDVIRDGDALQRRFSGWAMAYSGPAELLAPQLGPLTSAAAVDSVDAAAEELVALMLAFTQGRAAGRPH